MRDWDSMMMIIRWTLVRIILYTAALSLLFITRDAQSQTSEPKYLSGQYHYKIDGSRGAGQCERKCGIGRLLIEKDPLKAEANNPVEARLRIEGKLESGGNAVVNSGAHFDWGDGSPTVDAPAGQPLDVLLRHKYDKPGIYFPSAHTAADFKYDGGGIGSCSYHCDLRRSAVSVVFPKLEPPLLYVVTKGDSLSRISKVHYGVENWPLLQFANLKELGNPDKIFPGQTVLIPSLSSAQGKYSGFMSFFNKVQRSIGYSFDRFRSDKLDLPRTPDRESAASGGAQAAADLVVEKLRDKQVEKAKESLTQLIRTELQKSRARGITVKFGFYGIENTNRLSVTRFNPGLSPLDSMGSYYDGASISSPAPGPLQEDISFLSWATLEGQEVVFHDMPMGAFLRYDAEKLRQAAKAERGKLQSVMKSAKEFADEQRRVEMARAKQFLELNGELEKFQKSTAQRQTADFGQPANQPSKSPQERERSMREIGLPGHGGSQDARSDMSPGSSGETPTHTPQETQHGRQEALPPQPPVDIGPHEVPGHYKNEKP
jgi:hypothetical protein